MKETENEAVVMQNYAPSVDDSITGTVWRQGWEPRMGARGGKRIMSRSLAGSVAGLRTSRSR